MNYEYSDLSIDTISYDHGVFVLIVWTYLLCLLISGLFDQPVLVTSGKSNTILSSSQSLNKLSINTNINPSGRQTPANSKHNEHNQLEHGIHHLSKDNELEGSNILLGIGLNDTSNVTSANSAPNVCDIDSKGGTHEVCASIYNHISERFSVFCICYRLRICLIDYCSL